MATNAAKVMTMRTIKEIKAEIAEKKVNPPATDIAWVQKTARQYTVLLEEELHAAITDGIPLEHLETICAAYKDGRLMTLPKHRLANGSKAWIIDQHGDIQEGTISYCTSEYSMYFACKVCGFPFANFDISTLVFQTLLEAETAQKGEDHMDGN